MNPNWESLFIGLLKRSIVDAPCGENRKIWFCFCDKSTYLHMSSSQNHCKDSIIRKNVDCSAPVEICGCPESKQICDKLNLVSTFIKSNG